MTLLIIDASDARSLSQTHGQPKEPLSLLNTSSSFLGIKKDPYARMGHYSRWNFDGFLTHEGSSDDAYWSHWSHLSPNPARSSGILSCSLRTHFRYMEQTHHDQFEVK
jgi:hypothetical protein